MDGGIKDLLNKKKSIQGEKCLNIVDWKPK